MTITDNDTLLKAHEVAAILKVDRETVYRKLQDGSLKGHKIGHNWRVWRSDLWAYINRGNPRPVFSHLGE